MSLTGLVTAPDQWSTGHIQKSHSLRDVSPSIKLFREYVPDHLHVTLGRSHILAKCDYVDIVLPQL